MKGFVVLIIIHSLFGCSLALAQPNTTIDLEKEKPKQYQTRLLRSEKTGDGKLKYPGKIFQNAFSHYNYYFNANNKVNEIIAKVKQTHRDDFTKLLPFYNYQYRQTASYTNDIDSIILKCTAGIFLHDLRSDWVDNLYLLIGKAYLLKESYDSAAYVFQYINYAWAPNDDGYILTIGSNNGQKNSIFSIVTPEKRSFLQKLTHRTISRNESLLWMARTYIEQQKNNEASSLLAMLTADPAFPQRLQPQLHELWAYHYYQQKLNDSAAFHIEKALSVTSNKTEKARWLFLAGQLLQQIKQDSAATRYYERSIQATPDPLLEVYARLNMVQMGSNKQKKGSDDHLQQLYQLSKKDKYENYRDIILLVAAQLEMENKNLTAATNTARKSIKYNTDNPETKNKAWLLLADLYYTQNKYVQSAACYDSLDINAIASDQLELLNERKAALKKIAKNIQTIQFQDSVQALASLPEAERLELVKKKWKQIRKEKGLKEQDAAYEAMLLNNPNPTANTVLGNTGTNRTTTTNDFYFNNAALKQRGSAEFKVRWGNRPNVDNWRRQSAYSKAVSDPFLMKDIEDVPSGSGIPAENAEKSEKTEGTDLSLEGLLNGIPTTDDKKQLSDSLWAKSLFENGVTFQTELRNIPAAITCYEQFLAKFIQSSLSPNVLYNLVYCYQQSGQPEKANLKIDILREGYGNSSFTKSIVQNTAPQKPEKQIEAVYGEIFSLFQQNKWEQSIRLKDSLENIVGKNHRTQAIQYLDCIQLARTKQDSLAKEALVQFLKNHPTNPLAEKAQVLLEVLRERDAIELHLTYSTEEKIIDDTITERRIILEETKLQVQERNKPSIGNISAATTKPIINQPVALPPPAINNTQLSKAKEFVFDAKDKYWVGLIFKPNDESLNEVRNAFNRYNKQLFYDKVPVLNDINLNSDNKLLLYGTFEDAAAAMTYFDKIKLQTSYSIIPWIQPARYQFILISNQNLDLLKENKQLENYLNYIKKIFPDKF